MGNIRAAQALTLVFLIVLSSLATLSWWNTYRLQDWKTTSAGEWGQYITQGGEFGKLVFEFDWAQNCTPNPSSISSMVSQINALVEKQDGISTEMSSNLGTSDRTYTYNLTEIRALETKYRNITPDSWARKMAVYVLYLNGYYREQDGSVARKVLGLTYSGASMVVFRDVVWENPYETAQLKMEKETAVLIHEMGHIMGLVNIGYQSRFDHEHSTLTQENGTYIREYDRHCNDSSCVMFPEIERKDGPGSNLTYSAGFCPNCTADIKDMRGIIPGRLIARYVFLVLSACSWISSVVYGISLIRRSKKKDINGIQEDLT